MTATQSNPRSLSGAAAPAASSGPDAGPRVRLAYLTAQYPAVSHTFIRRELLELERRGYDIVRVSIRRADHRSVDPQDAEEERRTLVCLGSRGWLAGGLLRTMFLRPLALARAAAMAWGMARRGGAGLVRHGAYLVEASALYWELRRRAVRHVHVHFGTNPAAVARLLRRLGGPTYSLMLHGPIEWDEPGPLDIAGKIADAEFVAVISSFCASQAMRWASPSHWPRIHVVRCTVGEAYLAETPPPVPVDCRTLVHVGRFDAQKGHMLLVEAFAQAAADDPHARLVLIGDGGLRALVEGRVRELGLSERVEFTGWLAEAEVRRRILGSRAMVLPSFAEGLPVVIMEAMALGRPVLSTCIAGIPELVEPGRTGWLVPAGDGHALERAIREVLAAPGARINEMGAAGRRAVAERHNTAVEAGKLDALLRRYVGGSA